jgi:hypothetical protein
MIAVHVQTLVNLAKPPLQHELGKQRAIGTWVTPMETTSMQGIGADHPENRKAGDHPVKEIVITPSHIRDFCYVERTHHPPGPALLIRIAFDASAPIEWVFAQEILSSLVYHIYDRVGQNNIWFIIQNIYAPLEVSRFVLIVMCRPLEVNRVTRELKYPVEVGCRAKIGFISVIFNALISVGKPSHNLAGIVRRCVVGYYDLEVSEGLRNQRL